MKRICCGFSIQHSSHRKPLDEPTTVSLHRLGAGETAFMTPDEARALAKALSDVADDADRAATL